jgi:hypothetical protein
VTVGNVTVKPLKDLKNWFKLTFESQKNGIGATTTEMLASEETLRAIRNQIGKALGEKPDYSNLPENLRGFMEGEE